MKYAGLDQDEIAKVIKVANQKVGEMIEERYETFLRNWIKLLTTNNAQIYKRDEMIVVLKDYMNIKYRTFPNRIK